MKKDDTNSYSGEAITISSKQFQIDFPFGFLSKIRLNNVIMRVGVSYGKGDYSWQNVTFYDSLCRECNESNGYVNSKFIKLGTCVSKTGMCRKVNVII